MICSQSVCMPVKHQAIFEGDLHALSPRLREPWLGLVAHAALIGKSGGAEAACTGHYGVFTPFQFTPQVLLLTPVEGFVKLSIMVQSKKMEH